MSTATWIHGDVRDILPGLPDHSIDLVATSPPFWRQRAYLPVGHPDKAREIGQEASPAAFLDVLLALTAEFRRLLAPHGTICIELGDTMAGSGGAGGDYDPDGLRAGQPKWDGSARARSGARKHERVQAPGQATPILNRHGLVQPAAAGVLAKSHCMIPEAYRFALVWGINPFTGEPSPAGRWIVRNVVDWCRRNPTPGDDGDKFRRATSDIVCATLSAKRWWDGEAVRVPLADSPGNRYPRKISKADAAREGVTDDNVITKEYDATTGDGQRPLYDWWDLASDPYPGAHYAVWPPEIARRLIVSMCPAKVCTTCGVPQRRIVEPEYIPIQATNNATARGAIIGVNAPGADESYVHGRANRVNTTVGWTDCGHDTWRPGHVLDPFAGTGTTGSVATGNSRDATLIDLDNRNLDLAYDRIGGLFLNVRSDEARPIIDLPPL